MNGLEESALARSNSPRLPAEGEELKCFNDFTPSARFKCSTRSNTTEVQMASPSKDRTTAPISHCSNDVYLRNKGLMRQDKGQQQLDTCSNQSPLPCFRWAQDLQSLLNDHEGVKLFKDFLIQEGQNQNSFDFWFACEGLRKLPENEESNPTMKNRIHALYKRSLKIKEISLETKEEIKRKIHSKKSILSYHRTIFDAAQREVETHFMKSTYPNFLRSDVYIQYLHGYRDKTDEIEKERKSNTPDPTDHLPTVHEDAELQITSSSKLRFSKDQSQKSRFSDALTAKSEARPSGIYMKNQTGCYGSINSYHLKYASYLPTSAQDSELQSLSSDAQTDDTMSQTDSSVDYGPTHYSRSYQRKHQKAVKHNAALNRDSLASNNFIPRTQRLPPESTQNMTPEQFHSLLVKKLNKYLDEIKIREKINEKLQSIEGSETSSKVIENNQPQQKSQGKLLFDPNIFTKLGVFEDEDQDILDRHVSRVWKDSAHQTPGLSPGCISPLTGRTASETAEFRAASCRSGACEAMSDIEYQNNATCNFAPKMGQNPPFAASHSNSLKHRRDHDTRSSDSGTVQDFVSEEALATGHKGIISSASLDQFNSTTDHYRRHKELSKRSASRKHANSDSSSSCVDSGVSLVCNPIQLRGSAHDKVTSWLETKKHNADLDYHRRNSSTSPDLSRTSSSRKPTVYNSYRSGVQDNLSALWSFAPSQPYAQDPSMPALQPPDTTTQLVEARRRLEDENRFKMSKLKKQNRKSVPENSLQSSTSEMTVIGYCYGNQSVPYLSKFPGRNITLKQFKSHLSKKGNFRYFFKKASNDFGTGVVLEEISEDSEILPLWEGKVFSVIESVE